MEQKLGSRKSKIITEQEFKEAVKASLSICEALRKLGMCSHGGNYRVFKNTAKGYKVNTDHFIGRNGGGKKKPHKSLQELLVNKWTHSNKLKQRLLSEGIKTAKCESCNLTEWLGKPIPLELHHKDGNNSNNVLDNLQILCPNCHACPHNYRGKKSVLPKKDNTLATGKCTVCQTEVFNGNKTCSRKCIGMKIRRVERPSLDDLQKLMLINTWEQIADKFSVHKNTVKLWAKAYNIKK